VKTVSQKHRSALVTELKPHPENPNQGDVGAIYESIEENGWYGAINVQKSTGFVIAGSHRYLAAVQAGAKRIPIIEIDCSDRAALKILLADNRMRDLASYDVAAQTALVKMLAEEDDLAGTGYDGDDVDDLIAILQEEAGVNLTDGNVAHDPTINDRAQRYHDSTTRSVMLDYDLERFRWVVDNLAALREQFGLESNAEVVLLLVEQARDEKFVAGA
jgi:hypothetical protein